MSSGGSPEIHSREKEVQRSDMYHGPLCENLRKPATTSFSGFIRLSSSSFRPSANLNNLTFFFGLVLETSHSFAISLEGMTLSKPLNIRIGKEAGIPAILDTEPLLRDQEAKKTADTCK